MFFGVACIVRRTWTSFCHVALYGWLLRSGTYVQLFGLPAFRFADLAHHADLLPVARDLAESALARDRSLVGRGSERLRLLLHLFERHDAVRLLAAG